MVMSQPKPKPKCEMNTNVLVEGLRPSSSSFLAFRYPYLWSMAFTHFNLFHSSDEKISWSLWLVTTLLPMQWSNNGKLLQASPLLLGWPQSLMSKLSDSNLRNFTSSSSRLGH